MKNIIIKLFLFFIITNLPYEYVMAQSGDSTVVLKHNVAVWYLERHKLAETLEVKLSIRDSIIIIQDTRIDRKDSIIRKERLSKKEYRKIIKSLEKSKDTWKKDSQVKEKEIKKVKMQRNVFGILTIVITILALL